MGTTLHQLLIEHPDDILSRFGSQVRQTEVTPPGLSRPLLVDHIPAFLDEIAEELASGSGVHSTEDARSKSTTARRHGELRWRLGYDIAGLVREYGILRHAIMDEAKACGVALTIDDFDVVGKCLNVGVAEAISEYVHYRDQQLETQKKNLLFLVQAGELLASSLDYRATLSRL